VKLRNASVACLGIWALIWLVFLLLRIAPIDIRNIPGIGGIMLGALAIALLAPVAAAGFALAALARQPKVRLNWVMLAGAVAVLVGQGFVFLMTRWM
jgi:hypothetical protein